MADSVRGTSLLVEQRQRWERGEHVRVEAFREQHPDRRIGRESLIELIYNEVLLREELGEAPRLDEYVARFPDLADQLRIQFDLHAAIRADRLSLTSIHGTAGRISGPNVLEHRPANGDIVPGFEIMEELGRGGMGVVYKARQKSLNRIVALKMILSGQHASARTRARFRTEAEAVARLQHPSIVQIHEVGEHEGRLFFSLEYVEGGSLDRKLAGAPLPAKPAARLAEILARAMHYAHQRGIVHRDLKPANILLQIADRPLPTDQWEELNSAISNLQSAIPKITDFGLAKLLDAETGQTPTEAFLGTPNYMAPEQASGQSRAIGPASDVYSLGAILYEMLTGRPPFRGATLLETLEQVRRQDPVPPSRMQPKLARDLETICLKCLEKEPAKRYSSAEELAEDLRRFQAGEPIKARPVSTWQRGVKWARRRPAAALLLAVSVLALFVLFGQTLWHNLDLQVKVDEATANERTAQAEKRQIVEERLHEEEGRRTARETYQSFIRARDEALFHGIYGRLFLPADLPDSLEKSKRHALDALAIAGLHDSSESDPMFHPYFDARTKSEIVSSCYELLLLLADATAPPAAKPVKEAPQHARAALGYLARASRLRSPTHVYYVRRARYLASAGDDEGATREAARAEDLRPDSAIDFFLLGDEKLAKNEPRLAARDFEEALRRRPNHFWAQYCLAFCHLAQQQPDLAKVELTACLGWRPEFAWTYLLRGDASGELARQAYAGNRAEEARLQLDAAEADYRKALTFDLSADQRWILHVRRGVARSEMEPVKAIADLEEAIRLRPRHYVAYVNLAVIHWRRGQLKEAGEKFEEARRLNPSPSVLAGHLFARSADLYRDKKYRAAIRVCEDALKLARHSPMGNRLLGLNLLELRDYAAAAKAFQSYFDNGGTDREDVFRGRGIAREQLGDYLGAVDDYSRVLEAKEDDKIYAHRGWAYFFADAWKPALRDFERAVQLDGTNSDAYTGRGLARVMLGRHREAVADADEAVRLGPETPQNMHNIACTYALAAGRAQADKAKEGATLAKEYRKLAIATVQRALAMVRPEERAELWRKTIFPDPALAALHDSTEFKAWMKQYLHRDR